MASPEKIDRPPPTWVRETLVEDLADIQRAQGKLPETRKLEAVVDGDLQLFDARKREGKIKPPPSAVEREKTRRKIAERRITRTVAEGVSYYQRPVLTADDAVVQIASDPTTKLAKMMVRVQALTARDAKGMLMYPHWAREICDDIASQKVGVGPYRNLVEPVSSQLLRSRLENICDRSNCLIGFGGNWWVN